MPGKDEPEVENQEPTSQENESQKQEEAEPEKYEDRVLGAITGVMGEETS